MREEWKELDEFPDYAVSNLGNVVNMKTGRPISSSNNRQGVMKVGLYNGREAYTRSLAVMVAESFVDGWSHEFNTVIHLDGDRENCRADNLMWRPRWFAIKYHRQFSHEDFLVHRGGLMDEATGRIYANVREVCMTHGLYHVDVVVSAIQGGAVFPTWQEFRAV